MAQGTGKFAEQHDKTKMQWLLPQISSITTGAAFYTWMYMAPNNCLAYIRMYTQS